MTWKDKLEIGLKDDAAFRRDNLPEFQQTPAARPKKPADGTRSPEVPGARAEAAKQAGPRETPKRRGRRPPSSVRVRARTRKRT